MNKLMGLVMGLGMSFGLLAGEVPGWLTGWEFKGDVRLRYEGTDYDHFQVDGEELGKKDRNRGRFRLRLAAEKKLTDQLTFGMRLASGAGEPTSTNQSFDDGFSGKEIWIDRVFVEYQFDKALVVAGKVANPFETTDVVWDSDVNPEGIYESFGEKTFVHLAQFVVEEQSSKTDSHLFAGQVGHAFERGSVALGYYHYDDLADAGLPAAGNNGLAADFHLLDVVGQIKVSDKVKIIGHYVSNLGEDAAGEVDSQDTAYAVFVSYGKAKKPGEWDLSYKYAHIEANAVLGAYSDSDFGFADREGHKLSGTYQASKRMSWKAAVIATEGIENASADFARIQVDCNVKF